MKFTVEKDEPILPSDFKGLRTLYTPIVGTNSIALYSLLIDYSDHNHQIISFYPKRELTSILDISESELNLSLKKLEAVGLLRTFEKADNYHLIFKMNKPLGPNQFKKNDILFKLLNNKISDEIFERLEYDLKKKNYSKDEYTEVTTKFQDIFSFDSTNSTKKIDNTLELPEIAPKSIEEAIKGLSPAQFILFLTNKKVQSTMLTLLNHLLNSEFSSRAINLIIKYSYDVNGKVVKNHIEKIAADLLNKDRITFNMVNEELRAALEYKASKLKPSKTNKNKLEIDINELFSQMGDL